MAGPALLTAIGASTIVGRPGQRERARNTQGGQGAGVDESARQRKVEDMRTDLMAEGPGSARRAPSFVWKLAKKLYRHSIRFRARVPLMHTLFTEKEQMANVAMQYVRSNCVPGDYLEFGSYEGNSFISAYHLAQAQGLQDMRFYSFDSFRGLPEFKGIDQDRADAIQYYPGDFACDIQTFRRNLRSSGVGLAKVQLIEGFYEDSLKEELKAKLPIRAAAVVMVDCDLYESARLVLDFVTDYLVHGSILMFDDWYNFKGDPQRGEQRAFYEWLARNPAIKTSRYLNFGWHGLSFIILRGN